MELFDGSAATAGAITHFLRSSVIFANGFTQEIPLLVTPLHSRVQVVLGLSWLRVSNLLVDWRSMSLFLQDSDTLVPVLATSKDPADLQSVVMDLVEAEMDVLWQLAPWTFPVLPILNDLPR